LPGTTVLHEIEFEYLLTPQDWLSKQKDLKNGVFLNVEVYVKFPAVFLVAGLQTEFLQNT
jgi:hypothetical protein